MNCEQKILELRNIIDQQITPYINNDYVLWEVPYYTNIGDILIWEGELCFLRNSGYKCLEMASKDTCMFPKLSPQTVILLQGGGNFGDLWRDIHEFRLKVIENYPENRIIIFPQSVFYENKSLMAEDASKMALHKNLIICARDHSSYKILKENFINSILLVPDMAFCIDLDYLKKWILKETGKTLYVSRLDKEIGGLLSQEKISKENIDVSDWPTFEKPSLIVSFYSKLISLQQKIRKYKINQLIAGVLNDLIYRRMRPLMVQLGVRFIGSYQTVYTTRLHAMILSILLQKKIYVIDNSYGKNSSFYDTWLRDLDSVELYK